MKISNLLKFGTYWTFDSIITRYIEVSIMQIAMNHRGMAHKKWNFTIYLVLCTFSFFMNDAQLMQYTAVNFLTRIKLVEETFYSDLQCFFSPGQGKTSRSWCNKRKITETSLDNNIYSNILVIVHNLISCD